MQQGYLHAALFGNWTDSEHPASVSVSKMPTGLPDWIGNVLSFSNDATDRYGG
jgi:hypothetical protein